MSFKIQLAKAHAVALLAEIVKRDSAGRPNRIEVAGGGRRGYNVELVWKGHTVTASCNCRGASKGLCFHAMGSVILAFEELGCYVAMSPYKGNLVRLKRTGGQLFTLVNDYTGSEIFVLAKKVEIKNKLSFKDVIEQVDMSGELVDWELCPAEVCVK